MAKDAEQQQQQPRLCHVVKVPTFDGYGFNLLGEQGNSGQFIGKVDEGSPAELAGLKQGDKILEVNGVSIANDNHKQVVQKIKAVPGETRLLVVAPSQEEKVPSHNGTAKQTGEATTKTTTAATTSEPAPVPTEAPPRIVTTPPDSKLNLGMTAAEMRAQLAAKKKNDPKATKMDFKSKFDLVQKL